MCYKPPPTGMERVKVLSAVRLPAINLPEDFDEFELSNQVNDKFNETTVVKSAHTDKT